MQHTPTILDSNVQSLFPGILNIHHQVLASDNSCLRRQQVSRNCDRWIPRNRNFKFQNLVQIVYNEFLWRGGMRCLVIKFTDSNDDLAVRIQFDLHL